MKQVRARQNAVSCPQIVSFCLVFLYFSIKWVMVFTKGFFRPTKRGGELPFRWPQSRIPALRLVESFPSLVENHC